MRGMYSRVFALCVLRFRQRTRVLPTVLGSVAARTRVRIKMPEAAREVVDGREFCSDSLEWSAWLLWFKSGSAKPARAPDHEETAVLTHTDVRRC